VKELSRHILGSGRNITIDRYYTGIELVEDLMTNHKTTIVGTINANRQHVPDEMKSVKGRELNSTQFAWSGPIMMLSYVPNANKNVLLVSTQHDQPDISQRADRKPEVILAYNEDKGGVDVVDKMIDTYRSKAATLRWPMVVFYTVIDVAALNAFVIWLHKKPNWMSNKAKERRRLFLKELGTELILPLVQQRAANMNGLSSSCQQAIRTVLKPAIPEPEQPSTSAPKEAPGKCVVCITEGYGTGYKKAKNNANKVKQRCVTCHKPVCKKHSKQTQTITCNNCN
jgi:Transposase IS4